MIDGFRLIRTGTNGISYFSCTTGTVEYEPKVKYRIEKKNAFDPTLIHRRDPYHEDSLSLEAVLFPEEYVALMTFLSTEGRFYVEYDQVGKSRRMQFPITIESYPKCTDDLHSEADKVKFTAISRYSGTLPYLNFDYWIDTEEVMVVSTS